MTAPTNTVTTATRVGNREDLSDTIFRVAPEETPFISSLAKTKATGVYHEWLTETLAAPDATNAQLEGDTFALAAGNQPTRVGNICQIFSKVFGVSRTQQIVLSAGGNDELLRQKVLKGLELKTDMEKRFIGNYASVAESGATTRKAAGLCAWITSNDNRGSGGSDGGFSAGIVAAATNGTQRTFTEALVKATRATAFSNGAKPKLAFMGPTQKQNFSAFAGIASIRKEVTGDKMATIIAGAEIYVDDFGQLALIPHPYGLTRDCLLVDPTKVKVATLDGIKEKALAVVSDGEQMALTAEATLEVCNQKAHAVIADLS